MPNRLYLAPFGNQGASRLLFEEAIRQVTAVSPQPTADYSAITYLAPTPRKVRSAQIAFMELVGKSAVIPPVFATLNQFVTETWKQVGDRRRLDPQFKDLLIARVLPEIGVPEMSLGYARAISKFIKLIREYRPDLTPDQLEEQANVLLAGFDKPRRNLLNAVKVMRRYLALLEEKGWIDDEGIFREVQSAKHALERRAEILRFAQNDRREGCKVQSAGVLVLDGFDDLTRLQEQFLTGLMKAAGTVLALAYQPPGDVPDPSPRSFAEFVRAQVSAETVRLDALHPPRRKLKYYCFLSREDEVEGIAHDIKSRLLAGELDTGRTMVVFPSFPPYATIVKRVFSKYGIPHTIYPDRMLGSSPPIVAVLELLNAIENDYPRVTFTAALTSPWFVRLSDVCRGHVNRFSLMSGIVKGAKDWLNLRKRLEDDREIELSEADRQRLALVQNDVGLVIGFGKTYGLKPDARDTLTGFAQRLRKVLEEMKFGKDLDPEKDDEYLLHQDRRLLFGLLDEIVNFEAVFGKRGYLLSEFHRILGHMVRSLPAPPERELRGVLVCGTLEMRGLDCQHLYYGGLIEGELPSRFEHDPILPDSVRVKLNLPSIERHNQWQYLHFTRLVNTPTEEPFLSYPDTEDDRLLLLTPFLEGEELEPKQHLPNPDWIFTREEQQRDAGRAENVRYYDRIGPLDFAGDPEVAAEMRRRFGPEVYHSITRLERYRRCPVSFYLEEVLGLELRKEPAFQIAPTDWGNIYHEVLQKLYEHGQVPLKEIPDQLKRIVPAVLSEYGLPRFWRRAVERVLAEVEDDFLALEAKLREEGYVPTRVEGYVRGDVFPDVKLKGRVDRIDEGPGGLRVLDYKTGAVDVGKPDILQRGTHIQLPLYAKLVQDKHPDQNVDNIGIYKLRDMDIKWLAGKVSPEELIAATLNNLRQIIDAIRSARFPPDPGQRDACEPCPYNFICARQAAGSRRQASND